MIEKYTSYKDNLEFQEYLEWCGKRDPHPCQLPIHLMDRLILLTTDENDIVLDPFSGTGTTAIAAKRLGRKYIGFELDKKYAKISQEKLEQIKPNYKIGESWVSFYLKDIATIKNNDWGKLEQYFTIPNPARTIDYQKVELKNKFLIPRDLEFQTTDEIETEERKIFTITPKVPQREKVVAFVAAAANYSVYREEVLF
jgi:site-specific DNA-methyltransferase (adenine-specific)